MSYQLFFLHLFQHTHEAVLLLANDGQIVEANDAALQIYGYAQNELLGLNVQDLCAPESKFDTRGLIKEAESRAIISEMFHRRKSGETFPVEIACRSARPGDSEMLLCVICDTTEREPAEALKALSKSYEELKVDYEEIKAAYEELANATYDSLVDMNNLVISKLQEEMARKRAELMSTTDYLTGVLNRRAFENQLRAEVNRAQREGQPLGIILCDIDDFKLINDTYGHQIGDMVLKKIAALLVQKRRSYDFIGRYGGEEFIICLPGANGGEVFKIAERLRAAVQEFPIPLPGFHHVNVSASFGVAVLNPNENESLESLIQRADEALYRAKAEGKNCVR